MTAGARVLADVATSSGSGAAPVVVGAVVLVAVAVGVVVWLSRRR